MLALQPKSVKNSTMRTFFTLKRTIIIVVLTLCLIAAGIFSYQFKLLGRFWFNLRQWHNEHQWEKKSLWLSDYRVIIEAKPVEKVHNNLSGLTWNSDTQTLYSVINKPPQILELSTTGELLRTIDLEGINDPEAIEYIGDDQFIIADERRQRLLKVTVNKHTTHISDKDKEQISLSINEVGNKGIEGLAWDSTNKKLYAAKERDPVHIYEITGFPAASNTVTELEISSNPKRDNRLFVRDLSSLDFDKQYGHLLVLSDESKLIIEMDSKGHPISSMSLIIGMQGLSHSVPQPEGMALDDQGTLYLVSEPNLFYVFKKEKQ